MVDITVDGLLGFYQIQAGTPKGARFMRRVQGSQKGVAYCDDTLMTQDIADGAVRAGLHVEVNGAAYTGRSKQ